MTRIIYISLMLIAMTGCGKFGLYNYDKGEVLASVGDKKLYYSDIQHIMPPNISPSDSSALTKRFVENWLKNEVKLAAANQSLSENQSEIDELVEQYRRTLTINRYEEQIVNSKLDTTVTKDQIINYYENNRDNFKLQGPIVKGAIVRVPIQLKITPKFEQLFNSNSETEWHEFTAICDKNNYRLTDFSNNWIDFSVFITNIPFVDNEFDDFLRTKKYYEIEDQRYRYMMKIASYRPTNDLAPIENETNSIRKIILNGRRAELIHNLDDSLMNKAKVNNSVHYSL